MMVDCQEAQAALAAAGIVVESPTQPILDMARINDVTPQAIADIILSVARSATPDEIAAGLTSGQGRGSHEEVGSEGSGGRFEHPSVGLGRMTLRGYADEYGYGLDEILTILGRSGVEIDPDAPIREIANEMGIEPSGVIEALNAGG